MSADLTVRPAYEKSNSSAAPRFPPCCISVKPMNKLDLASRLAKEFHRSQAKAADDVDAFIYHLIKDLKRPSEAGQPLPVKTEKQTSPSPARPKEKR